MADINSIFIKYFDSDSTIDPGDECKHMPVWSQDFRKYYCAECGILNISSPPPREADDTQRFDDRIVMQPIEPRLQYMNSVLSKHFGHVAIKPDVYKEIKDFAASHRAEIRACETRQQIKRLLKTLPNSKLAAAYTATLIQLCGARDAFPGNEAIQVLKRKFQRESIAVHPKKIKVSVYLAHIINQPIEWQAA